MSAARPDLSEPIITSGAMNAARKLRTITTTINTNKTYNSQKKIHPTCCRLKRRAKVRLLSQKEAYTVSRKNVQKKLIKISFCYPASSEKFDIRWLYNCALHLNTVAAL